MKNIIGHIKNIIGHIENIIGHFKIIGHLKNYRTFEKLSDI